MLPLSQTYFNQLDVNSVVKIVDSGHTNLMYNAKYIIYDSLESVDIILSKSKFSKCLITNNCRTRNRFDGLDLRHVFIIEFSDGSVSYIGYSSVKKYFEINHYVFKKDKQLTKALYQFCKKYSQKH